MIPEIEVHCGEIIDIFLNESIADAPEEMK